MTLEDLVEQILGEIQDEYDNEEELPSLPSGGQVEVDGLVSIEDLNEESGIAIDEGPYATLAGFIMHELGRLPELNDQLEVNGLVFTVLKMDGKRIERVRIARLNEDPSHDQDMER